MNITQQVRDLTGITAHALARKIGVTATDVEAWEAGTSTPSPDAIAVFHELLDRTKVEDSSQGPRASRPMLESEIVCADSIEYLRQIPDESVEMILSDIPYGIGLDDWDVLHENTNSAYMGSSAAQERAGKVFGKRRKPINGWSSADRNIPREYQEWCSKWASEWLRVLRPGGSAMVFAGRRLAHRCVAALEDAGFNLRDILGWVRPNAAFRAQRLSVVYQKRGDLAQARRWVGWRVGNLRPNFEPIVWCFKPYAITIADNMLDHQVGAYNFARYERLTGHQDNILEAGSTPSDSDRIVYCARTNGTRPICWEWFYGCCCEKLWPPIHDDRGRSRTLSNNKAARGRFNTSVLDCILMLNYKGNYMMTIQGCAIIGYSESRAIEKVRNNDGTIIDMKPFPVTTVVDLQLPSGAVVKAELTQTDFASYVVPLFQSSQA